MKCKEIKKKVATKIAKGKTKVAKKCGKTAKRACALVAIATLCVLCGCQATPSRSQSLTIEHCQINIYGGGPETNDIARVEIASQAMSIENSGTETQTATQTTDTKPDVDVTVGGAKAGGGLLETVAGKLLSGSTASATSDTASATSDTASACADGSCTPNGACADGSCSL